MHLFRNFSKFARISEDDKIPRKIRFNLDLLSKPNIYKPDKTWKIVRVLQDIDKQCKKSLTMPKIDMSRLPAIRYASEKIPELLDHFDLPLTIKLMRELDNFKLKSDTLWLEIEKSILTTHLNSIDSHNIYGVVQCFSNAQKGSPDFWKKIETLVIERCCPLHNMNAYTIATLIHAFKRNRILNDNFLIIMEQQLFRACMELDGIDLSRILYTYAQHKVGSDTLYKVLIDRAYVKREKMGAFDFTIILTGLAKSNKGKPTDYAEFEDLLLSLSWKDVTIQNIAGIFNAYAKYMNPKLLDKPERIRFLNDLKDRLIDKSNYLKNEADLTILHLLYGLNKLGLNGDTELIGLLRSQFRLRKVTSKTEFQNFIKENNKYLV